MTFDIYIEHKKPNSRIKNRSNSSYTTVKTPKMS